MEIYLIRHADALPAGAGGAQSDADRPLSEVGKSQAKALAAAFQRQGLHLDCVLTSPLLRARQTAEEMLRHWQGPPPVVQVQAELNMDGRPRRLFRAVRALGQQAVALIGHQPDLVAHTAWLIGSKKARLDLAKAGVACVQCDAPEKGGGVLLWLVTPEWFDAK